MDILVYGAGAVGSYLGGKLALAGHRVTLVTRPDTAELINEKRLLITEPGRSITPRVRAIGHLSHAFQSNQEYGLIILGMKAYDLKAAVSHLATLCPRPAQLMTLQNGIGVEEIIADQFHADSILAGVVTIPISRIEANHFDVEREGRGIGIAPIRPGKSIHEWVRLFSDSGLNAGAVADYRAMKWSKAFLNIMGNASSAILDCPPVDIYRQPELFNLEMRMLREMLAVMRRLGLEVINLPGASARPLAKLLTFAPRALLRLIFTQVIIHGRGDKMPSFHMDLAAGKGHSEVIFHNGAIAAAGQTNGIPTPVNAALNNVLMRLTNGQVPRSDFARHPEGLLDELAQYEQLMNPS
jgi:2-dehydropantoate 2-reductase